VPNAQLQSYVSGIGNRMTEFVEPGVQAEWEFTLLNTNAVNAFALPGGKVFFTRGLAERLTNEAQMAGVIGHEIGHVTARHGNQRISKQIGFNVALVTAAVAVGVSDADSDVRKYGQYAVPALAIGGNVILLKYGREEELEADMLGMRYMSRVGYDPIGQRQVMQVLAELSKGPRQIELLSTHPYPESRIEQIERLLEREYANTQNNPDYQLYEGRYKQQFLDVIAKVAPAPQQQQGALPMDDATVALGNPVTWCAHCAAPRTSNE
jgi:predicted Zn-dependent protease